MGSARRNLARCTTRPPASQMQMQNKAVDDFCIRLVPCGRHQLRAEGWSWLSSRWTSLPPAHSPCSIASPPRPVPPADRTARIRSRATQPIRFARGIAAPSRVVVSSTATNHEKGVLVGVSSRQREALNARCAPYSGGRRPTEWIDALAHTHNRQLSRHDTNGEGAWPAAPAPLGVWARTLSAAVASAVLVRSACSACGSALVCVLNAATACPSSPVSAYTSTHPPSSFQRRPLPTLRSASAAS
jgi:hypothetical protein